MVKSDGVNKRVALNALRTQVLTARGAGASEGDIQQVVTTFSVVSAGRGRGEEAPAPGLPMFSVAPEGLLTLRGAADEFNRSVQALRNWVWRGHLKVRGRLRAPARGGGMVLVAREDLESLLQNPPRRTGRPPNP